MQIDLTKPQVELVRSLLQDWLDAMVDEDEGARSAMAQAMRHAEVILKKLEVP